MLTSIEHIVTHLPLHDNKCIYKEHRSHWSILLQRQLVSRSTIRHFLVLQKLRLVRLDTFANAMKQRDHKFHTICTNSEQNEQVQITGILALC